jgi:hypothetical protein
MSAHRKGTLSDAQTLGMYEDGVSIIALCVHEGMTCYGVTTRLTRARRKLATPRQRRAVAQPTYTSFDALHAAVRALEAREKEYTR